MNNTFCVAAQAAHYTFSAVTCVSAPLHYLCMTDIKKRGADHTAQLSGQRIRAARDARGWTQEQLARQTGWVTHEPSRAQRSALAPSRIANFEQGTRRVGLEEAQILAATFGDFPAPYWMGVISEQEAAVLAAMRRPGAPAPPSHPPHLTDQPAFPGVP